MSLQPQPSPTFPPATSKRSLRDRLGISSRSRRRSGSTSLAPTVVNQNGGQGANTISENASTSTSLAISRDYGSPVTAIANPKITLPTATTESFNPASKPATATAAILAPSMQASPVQTSIQKTSSSASSIYPPRHVVASHALLAPPSHSNGGHITPTKHEGLENEWSSLWQKALKSLEPAEQQHFSAASGASKGDVLNEVREMVETKHKECIAKGWKFRWRDHEIILRDVASKIISWLEKFKEIGDLIAQVDPIHVGLPWAGIRFILQCSLNEKERLGSLLVGLEKITNLLDRCAIYEKVYFQYDTKKALEKSITKLYCEILRYLFQAYKFFGSSTTVRIVKNALGPDPTPDMLNSIEGHEKNLIERAHALDMEVSQQVRREIIDGHDKLMKLLAGLDLPIERIDARLKDISIHLSEFERDRILRWISNLLYYQNYKNALEGLVPGTGEWLLKGTTYQDWRKSSCSGMLWLHGNPDVSSALVIRTLCDESPNEPTAFFLCKRDEQERREPVNIARAFVKQLSIIEDNIDASLVDLYKSDSKIGGAGGAPNLEECRRLLLELINKRPIVNLVLDALDECDKKDRRKILDLMKSLLKESRSLLKVFISSREEQDILNQIDLEDEDFRNHYISPEDNDQDIEKYVKTRVRELSKAGEFLNGEELRDQVQYEIEDKLAELADGMFQWVVLSIDHLCTYNDEFSLLEGLGKLPRKLDAVYDLMFESIRDEDKYGNEVAFSALKWVMAALHPLPPEQICSALQFRSNRMSGPNIKTILKVCHNLLVVDQQVGVLRFSHMSVRQYLENRKSFTTAEAHLYVAETVIERLKYPGHYDNHDKDDGKFDEYCMKAWPTHVRECQELCDISQLVSSLSEFIGPPNQTTKAYQRWCQRLEYLIFGSNNVQRTGLLRTVVHILEVPYPLFVIYGLNQAVPSYWASKDLNINKMFHLNTGDEGLSLLHIACRCSNLPIVETLINSKKKDVAVDDMLGSPPTSPVLYGDENNSKSWLNKEARVKPFHGKFEFALSTAATAYNSEPMIKLLLDRGADINLVSGMFGSALSTAVIYNDETVVRLLLDRGADVNLVGGRYGCALSAAVVAPDGGLMVKLLLDHGADVNLVCGHYGSALSTAVIHHNETVARLLLDRGADVNLVTNGKYKCILEAAIAGPIEENDDTASIVKLLLASGARLPEDSAYKDKLQETIPKIGEEDFGVQHAGNNKGDSELRRNHGPGDN